jgi:hypothetical protein
MKNEHRIEKATSRRATIVFGNGEELTEDQAAAVKEFIEQLGSIENARRAIAALKELHKKAA